jgi:excinuclease ABC subunit A
MAPRVFSFNSRYGACPTCEGLGAIPEVDEDRMVPNADLSLHQGAIAPFKWFFQKRKASELKQYRAASSTLDRLYNVIDAREIDLSVPWNSLPKADRDLLLYGSKKTTEKAAGSGKKKGADLSDWRGLVARLTERLEEAQSDEDYDNFADYLRHVPCPDCGGARLRKESLAVTLGDLNISQICQLDIRRCLEFFKALQFTDRQKEIAHQPLREVIDRLGFLDAVGLEYLTLDRGAATLSGGEGQRIRLATQIGSSLVGVLYILDEPSIGLHQRDNSRLLATLKRLRDLGNTVIVVEHDEETIASADWVVDMGPGAGRHGGVVVAAGTPEEIRAHPESLTGQYLSGARKIDVPSQRRTPQATSLVVRGARGNNLRGVDVEFPLGVLVCVTGVSGSGKSTLVNDTLYTALARDLLGAKDEPAAHDGVDGLEAVDKIIDINQSPIGRTPRSNPATYTGLFGDIRDLFAQLEEAKMRGYGPGRFSFNVKGGRCESCEGDGIIRIEMHFLPDIFVTCEVCGGRRYNRETLEVRYKGKSIADVLEMTVADALDFLGAIPSAQRKLQTLFDVGLGYIHLGQQATTLSGGEAQRVKLAKELSRRGTGRTVYVLDEPTTGLHFEDVAKLLDVLQKLVDQGNSVLVIEHNLDVIKAADWIIDMGPEGGTDNRGPFPARPG